MHYNSNIKNHFTVPNFKCYNLAMLYKLQGNLVAVGTHKGHVQVWDASANKRIGLLEGHTARVGALAWNGDQLSSGSRDRMIFQRDIRSRSAVSSGNADRKLAGHRQEVMYICIALQECLSE